MTDTTLTRAQGGDGEAFRELTEPYRRELLTHCYRLLGSLQDSEDVLQEVLLSAWRSIGSFDGRSLRSWLYRIATNRCFNFLRDQSRRPRRAVGMSSGAGAVPAEDPWWLEPLPDSLVDEAVAGPESHYETRESVALSFVSSLQRLPAQQRAVLVLRDVLGFPASETAEILGTSTASVNSTLLRARGGVSPPQTREQFPLPRSAEEKELADRFVEAFETVDIDKVVALLTADARFAMPPEPVEFHGRMPVARFLQSLPFWGQPLRLVASRANGQPAFGYYVFDPAAGVFQGNGLMVLDLRPDGVSGITRFGGPAVLARFGLPATLRA